MAEEIKPIGLDDTGYNMITEAMRVLLNQFPGLEDGDMILFEQLQKDSGIIFSADNGALIMSERVSVTDHVYQTCQYPFYIVYRTASSTERQKIRVQEFLNNIGKWLSKEVVNINGTEYRLSDYPELTDGRVIKKITRDNSYGLTPQDNGVQDWLIPCVVQYIHEYDKII